MALYWESKTDLSADFFSFSFALSYEISGTIEQWSIKELNKKQQNIGVWLKEVRVRRKEHIEELRGCGRKKRERALGRDLSLPSSRLTIWESHEYLEHWTSYAWSQLSREFLMILAPWYSYPYVFSCHIGKGWPGWPIGCDWVCLLSLSDKRYVGSALLSWTTQCGKASCHVVRTLEKRWGP